ncbi:hypothetical protein BRYFOR_07432 [Marvinbryantia formatexigens DSM 14469]|uniref:Uncharacterized protein n=1 Tax=Marvinbryantia formatexigens DSM 14469 TaxID=478749 RepID=C6LFM9_9FIRM|nr:hypothetical protein BRYFOR_07432 [Marvinbryantia formatexigens DSM 14469]
MLACKQMFLIFGIWRLAISHRQELCKQRIACAAGGLWLDG